MESGFGILGYFCFVLLLSLLSSTVADSSSPNPDKHDSSRKPKEQNQYIPDLPKEVIVIGGGIAGLTAARTLTKDHTNFTVKVFEAEKTRYGGRAWTDKITNMKARGIDVNLGAIALNVLAQNNPLLELVENFELQTATLENPQFIIPWKGVALDGEDLAEARKEAIQILDQALNQSAKSNIEISVKDAVDDVLKMRDVSKSDGAGEELVKCLPSYLLRDYSSRDYRPEWRDSGFERVLLDGMGELADRLASGADDEGPLHIHLNKAVRQIKVDEEKGKVIVRTTDGLQTQADIVVISVPPAVIAAQDILFEPALPKDYLLASQELASAEGNVVIVEFESVFWSSDFGIFTRAVESDDQRGHLQTWFNIHRLIHRPVLTGSLVGSPAVEFEKLSDEQAKQSVVSALGDMFGEDKVKQGGKIVRLQRSKWMSDSLYRGTGTYPKVGTSPKLWDVMSEPLCPFIYFAGEHTNSESPGTVHGAYNSGVRVGMQIRSRLCAVRMEEERMRKEMERRKKKEEEEERKKNSAGGSGSNKDELKDEL